VTNRAFDFIRFLSEVCLSALGALYYALAEIWGLPYGDAILATCAALSTFLGIFTEWQRIRYNKKGEENGEDLLKSVKPDGK